MTSVIVDLDVLADSAWREDVRASGDWDAYHAAAAADRVDLRALMLVEGLTRMGATVTVVSARPERWMQSTIQWLVMMGVSINRMTMRPTGDQRTNPDVVADLIAKEPRPNFVLLGDDERIVEAVRATGVFIVQVHRP